MSYTSGIIKKGIICLLSALLICSLSACKSSKGENYNSDDTTDYNQSEGYTEDEAAEMAEEEGGVNKYFVKSGDMFYPLPFAETMWHDSSFYWEDGYMITEESEHVKTPTVNMDEGDELVCFYSSDNPGTGFFVTRLTDVGFTIPLQFIGYDYEDTGESGYVATGLGIDDVAHVYSETDDEELEIPLDRIKEINDRTIEELCNSPEVEILTGDELYEHSPSDKSYDEFKYGGKDSEYSLYNREYKDTEICVLKCGLNDKVKVLYQDGAEDREIMLRAKTKAYFTYEKNMYAAAGDEDTGIYQTIDISELNAGDYSIRTTDVGGNIFSIEKSQNS